MPQTHRIGDPNTGGGSVTSTTQSTVYADNILVSTDGSAVSPHGNGVHAGPVTANGGPTVFAENIPINKAGDADTCGHARAAGSSDVFNDAFVGGGAMFDNNPPYGGNPPPGAQPSPPAGYENNTIATIYVFENDDLLEHNDPINGNPAALDNTDFAPYEEQEEDVTQPPPNTPPTQDCSTVNSLPANFNWSTEPGATTFPAWAQSFALSPNFTVWDMCNGAVGRHQFNSSVTQPAGYTQKQILLNMCHHAKIVLEPILAAYGSFIITSGYRSYTGTSQHNRGQATDIQFPSIQGGSRRTVSDNYYARAQDVRDNINFDQLILEWFGNNPWLHLSSNPSGHRKKLTTQVSRSPSYKSGLILMYV